MLPKGGWHHATEVLAQSLEIWSFLDEALCRKMIISRFSIRAKVSFSIALTRRNNKFLKDFLLAGNMYVLLSYTYNFS
jgi:hypothetical protein